MPPPLNLNPVPISARQTQIDEMAAYFNGSGEGALLTCVPYSNPVSVSATSVLADFTASTFTGAAPVTVAPGTPTFDTPSQEVHVTAGTVTFTGTNGQQQTISNVAVGPITMSGSLSVIVTAAGMEDSPVTVAVPVLTTDNNAEVAEKIEEALIADEDIGPFFNITSVGNVVFLQAKVAAANDATMNMSFATGTATGLVAKPTATQVLPGVAPGSFTSGSVSGCYLLDSNGNYRGAFPAGAQYPISAPGQSVSIEIDIPYGW